jgi:hypothetical protein
LSALRTGRPLPPMKIPGTHFSTPGPSCSWENEVNGKTSTSSGLESATFRFVAWCLNKLCYRVPPCSNLYEPLYCHAIEVTVDEVWIDSQSQNHVATDGQSVCLSLGVEPQLGLMTRCFLLCESCCPVHLGRPLRREVESVI